MWIMMNAIYLNGMNKCDAVGIVTHCARYFYKCFIPQG
jgi:hypothetical protein